MLPGSSSESAYCWADGAEPPGARRSAPPCRRPCWSPSGAVARVALAGGHVGEVAQPADRVDGVVELLLAHALALDVAEPLGPAVLVGVELAEDVLHVAHAEAVHLVAEPVVAGPAPHQGHGARELRGLVGVAGVAVGAEVDLTVRRHLVHDLAAGAVGDLAHVAERAQVVLDRRRTGRWPPPRTRCTRRRSRTARGSPASPRRTSVPWPPCPAGPGRPCRRW